MLFQAFVAALGAGVAAAQLTSQCEFVSFSPAKGSDPIEYTARCSTTPGGHAKTCSQLDLSHCLANEDGHLQLPTHGNTEVFTKTCPSCHVDGGGRRLYCLCERMDMSYNYTWVELSTLPDAYDGGGSPMLT